MKNGGVNLKEFSCFWMMVSVVIVQDKKNVDIATEIKQFCTVLYLKLSCGIVPKVEKCLWVPVQSIQFLVC